MPGSDSFYPFFQQNPDISKRRAQAINPTRAQKLNKATVDDYFKKVEQTIKPQNLFNMDEKGCHLTLYNQ